MQCTRQSHSNETRVQGMTGTLSKNGAENRAFTLIFIFEDDTLFSLFHFTNTVAQQHLPIKPSLSYLFWFEQKVRGEVVAAAAKMRASTWRPARRARTSFTTQNSFTSISLVCIENNRKER